MSVHKVNILFAPFFSKRPFIEKTKNKCTPQKVLFFGAEVPQINKANKLR